MYACRISSCVLNERQVRAGGQLLGIKIPYTHNGIIPAGDGTSFEVSHSGLSPNAAATISRSVFNLQGGWGISRPMVSCQIIRIDTQYRAGDERQERDLWVLTLDIMLIFRLAADEEMLGNLTVTTAQ